MPKRKGEKNVSIIQLGDFGTKESRQQGTVVIETAHEGKSLTVKRARRLTPLEDYHSRGLLSLAGKGDLNDASLAAGQRFFALWHRYHVVIGTPTSRCVLSEYVSGRGMSLYQGENDAKVQQEYTELRGYVGRALFPYLEKVAGEGYYAEEVAGSMRCNTNQFMHALRLALDECVRFWSY